MIEQTTQDDHDGPLPTLSMPVAHFMQPPIVDSKAFAESQRTQCHDIMTSQPGSYSALEVFLDHYMNNTDEVSTSHSNDHEEKADTNQPLVATDDYESSNTIERVCSYGYCSPIDQLCCT